MRRETPGPLSSIDMVPDEGRNDIQWALDELNKRQRTQADILFELNDRLAVHGIGPISRSAFNRLAVRLYLQKKIAEEQHQMTTQALEFFKDRKLSDTDLFLFELQKTLLVETTEAMQGRPDPKLAKELTAAHLNTLKAKSLSMDIEERERKAFNEAASAAIANVAKVRGLSAEVAKDIRAQILGVKE